MLNSLGEEAKIKISDSYKVFLSDLNSVRTGVASPSLLDGVVVELETGKLKLNQIANISIVNSKMLSVNIWDKNNVHAAKDAVLKSDLGLNPIIEGSVMRIPLPDLTEERRKDLVKALKKYSDRAKIALRNIRKGCINKIKSLEKEKEISEDLMHAEIKKVDTLIAQEEKKIDSAALKKEEEILKV